MTSAEEEYLKAIYQLDIGDNRMISTNAIAVQMATRPASVTDMVKKLAKKGYVAHTLYKGVKLTEKGRVSALAILRKLRLWEVFLTQNLNFAKDVVPEIAQQLQHMKSELLVDKLDRYLGFPTVDAHGNSMPSQDGALKKLEKKLLSEASIGSKGTCVGVKDSSAAFLNFLDKNHIALGDTLEILDKEVFDGSLHIKVNAKAMHMSSQIAGNLYIAMQ